MSELCRIDPQAVAAWFKAHPRVRVLREEFVRFDYDYLGNPPVVWGCCGLMSQLADLPPSSLRGLDGILLPYRKIAALLDLDQYYAQGFIMGWDGEDQSRYPSESGKLGYADGEAAYEATMEFVRS